MTRLRWTSYAAVMVWMGLGVGTALAAAIPPVGAPAGTVVTLSVLQGNLDIADTYLPTVTINPTTRTVVGAPVTLRVNGLAGATLSLAASTAYPGTCTNFSAPRVSGQASTDTSSSGQPAPDFTLVGNTLTSLDCGGTATIEVRGGGSVFTFKLPQDANNNGIADSFERAFGGNLAPGADPDLDGITNLDEYRGFIVSGMHVRGNPTLKDLFVFLVNPQTTGSVSLPAGASLLGKLPGDNRTVYPIDGTPLTATFDAISAVARVWLLGHKRDASGNIIYDGTNKNTDEMIDRLQSFSITAGKETFVYRTSDLSTALVTITNLNRKSTPIDDRVINKNRVLPTSPAQGHPDHGVARREQDDSHRLLDLGVAQWPERGDHLHAADRGLHQHHGPDHRDAHLLRHSQRRRLGCVPEHLPARERSAAADQPQRTSSPR